VSSKLSSPPNRKRSGAVHSTLLPSRSTEGVGLEDDEWTGDDVMAGEYKRIRIMLSL
jgi:hypothetical protein